eukprot:766715-Hanusia_phi.AAC.9
MISLSTKSGFESLIAGFLILSIYPYASTSQRLHVAQGCCVQYFCPEQNFRIRLRGGGVEDHSADTQTIINEPTYGKEEDFNGYGELEKKGDSWSILKPGTGHFPYPRVPLRFLYNDTLARRDPYIQALNRSNVSANENLWMKDILPAKHDLGTLQGFIDYYNDPNVDESDEDFTLCPENITLDAWPNNPDGYELLELPVSETLNFQEEAAEQGDFAGMVLGCGGNELGQLGIGECHAYEPAHGSIPEYARGADYGYDASGFPVDYGGVEHYGSNTVPQALDRLRHVALKFLRCGWNHAFGLAEDGQGKQTLYGWGCNGFGQLGLETEEPIFAPQEIFLDQVDQSIKDIACGLCHTVVLCKDGSVFSLGGNSFGQLGLDISFESIIFKPQRVSLPGKCASIACGDRHSIFVLEDGGKECLNVSSPALVQAFVGVGVRVVGCGSECTIVVDRDEKVWAFGSNTFGELGCYKHPTQYDSHEVCQEWKPPEKPNQRVSKIFCGVQHTILLFEDGELWGCGRNTFGTVSEAQCHCTLISGAAGVEPSGDGVPPDSCHSLMFIRHQVACGYGFTIAALDNGDVVRGKPLSEDGRTCADSGLQSAKLSHREHDGNNICLQQLISQCFQYFPVDFN